MNTQTVKRIADRLESPQRGRRTRDYRAKDKRNVRDLLDAYRVGYTDELED